MNLEGGANSWCRPPLRRLDEKKDTISKQRFLDGSCNSPSALEVFQQIDVEEAYDIGGGGSGGRLRMYGVTEVLVAFPFFTFKVINVSTGRE